MNYPLRENLEVYADAGGQWVRCVRCLRMLCRADEDWRRACRIRLLPPTHAGPLMSELLDQFLLEQLYCPSCGVLLNTDLVEKGTGDGEGRNRPEPKSVSLDRETTAVMVLDLSARCHDSKEVCSQLMEPVAEFLERARRFSVPIVFTVSAAAKDTAAGEVAFPLKRRETEPVIYPDAFDKFVGGELQHLLRQKGILSLVVLGASTNVAVLYTSTTAARVYRYRVIIPMDGVIAKSKYEQEYTFHQLAVLPSGASRLIELTTLSMIDFH